MANGNAKTAYERCDRCVRISYYIFENCYSWLNAAQKKIRKKEEKINNSSTSWFNFIGPFYFDRFHDWWLNIFVFDCSFVRCEFTHEIESFARENAARAYFGYFWSFVCMYFRGKINTKYSYNTLWFGTKNKTKICGEKIAKVKTEAEIWNKKKEKKVLYFSFNFFFFFFLLCVRLVHVWMWSTAVRWFNSIGKIRWINKSERSINFAGNAHAQKYITVGPPISELRNRFDFDPSGFHPKNKCPPACVRLNALGECVWRTRNKKKSEFN